MNEKQEAFKELIEKYNEYHAKWIAMNKTEEGFSQWFTEQIAKGDNNV